MTLYAVVLAAGEGRRMGGAKALLVVDGRPLVVRHVERLCALGCAEVVIVVRPEVAASVSRVLASASSAAAAAGTEVRIVAAVTSSQAASLVAALAALRGHAELSAHDVVVVVPVDMRPVSLPTLHALREALGGDVLAASPIADGRGGHPVVARAELFAAYDRLAPAAEPPPLRDVLAAVGARRVRVEVTSDHVLDDLDEPADLGRGVEGDAGGGGGAVTWAE